MILATPGNITTALLEGVSTALVITARLVDGDETLATVVTVTPKLDATGLPLAARDASFVAPTSLPVTLQWLQGTVVVGEETVAFDAAGTVIPAGFYATVAQLRDALNPAGSVDSGTAATLPDGELQSALARATAEIDGYLSGLYSVPMQPPIPTLVTQLTIDLAALEATLRYRRNVPLDPNDPVRLRGTEARRLLASVGTGRVDLIGVAGRSAQASEAAVVNPAGNEVPLWSLADFGLSGRYEDSWPVGGRG